MKKILRHLVAMIFISMIAGLILAILGPLGTGRLTFIERLVYWVGLCAAGGLGACIIDIIVMRFGWALKLWSLAIGRSIGATIFVSAMLFYMWPPSSLVSAVMTIFYVWVISIVISGVGVLIKSKEEDDTDKLKRPAILDRLPPRLRSAEIYAISAEDHYVRVHTSKGDEMVLMRLSDAIKEMNPLIGEQVHRSWWVAEVGIETVDRKNGKTQIKLKNEVIAPVSRSGQKSVKEAGWV